MLDRPDFPDEKITACLQTDFGLAIARLEFLPLGTDLSTAVYRAVADDGTAYFCKLKGGVFDETAVELPKFLSDQGIAQIIAPLASKTGRLRAQLDEFKLILYPYIESNSKNGYEVALSDTQWAEFGAGLKRIHTTTPPPALIANMRTERFASPWGGRCMAWMARLESEALDDPILLDLAAFMKSKHAVIRDMIERVARYGQIVAARAPEFVVCHTDLHPGNLYLDTREALYIVDWDYPILAPKEHDLMFIGDGQGFMGVTAQEEETRFYQGYGAAQVDPIALAYYRFDRNLVDIAVACEQIFASKQGGEDRAQCLQYLKWGFGPGGAVEMAYRPEPPPGGATLSS